MATKVPTPNAGFVASLHAYDPLLNVRWGPFVGRWVVDRKGVLTETELWFLKRRTARFAKWVQDPSLQPEKRKEREIQFDEIREELHSAISGRRVVMMPKELNTLAFNTLAMMDIQRWGGYSRMADELERRDAQAEADMDRQMANEREALGKQFHDVLNFLWHHRKQELHSGSYRQKTLKDLLNTSEV